MSKKIFLLFVIFFCIIGCEKIKENPKYEVDYNEEEIINYSNMETMNAHTIIDNIKYNYIFYFDNDRVENAKVEVYFEDETSALKFKESIESNEDYIDVVIENNKVSYLHNLETFMYTNYKKEVLSELLEENNFVIE